MINNAAIMICGDASQDGAEPQVFQQLADTLSKNLEGHEIAFGLMDSNDHSINAGLEDLKSRGASKIVCLPGMLFTPADVKSALPNAINDFDVANPDIDVTLGKDLGIDPKMLLAAQARVLEAMPDTESMGDTVLMIVGAGARDAEANAHVAKMARLLLEGMGFAWLEVCYSGEVFPSVDQAIKQTVKLPYKKILVLPYLLFTGRAVEGIYADVDKAAVSYPEHTFIKVQPLGAQQHLIETMVERVDQALEGGYANAMNCQLCTFREQVLGQDAGHDP
jgi:sirohydrochlorin cobaltochelatase